MMASDGSCLRNGQDDAIGGIGCGIWTRTNRRRDGWNSIIEISESLDSTCNEFNMIATSPVAELGAILRVLRVIVEMIDYTCNFDDCEEFVLSTDSEYALNSIFINIPKWKKRAEKQRVSTWLRRGNVAAANQRIFEEILEILDENFAGPDRTLRFNHCVSHDRDGHTTCRFNRIVDELASDGVSN